MVIGRPLTGYRNAFKITKVGEPFDAHTPDDRTFVIGSIEVLNDDLDRPIRVVFFDANGVIRRFVIPGPGDVFVYDHQ